MIPRNLVLLLLIFFLYSCEGPSPNSDWKERDDFIGPNGETMTGEDAEKSGLVMYNILKWILKKEAIDTLDVISKPLPWDKYNTADLNLLKLEAIKNGYTFTNKISRFDKTKRYPTFYYELGVFPKEEEVHKANLYWKIKNHKYAFQNKEGEDIEISFFRDPDNIPIRVNSSSTITGEPNAKYVTENTYYAEIEYKPKNKEEVINTGKVSFDLFVKTGYSKQSIDASSKGKTIEYKGRKLKVKDFKADFAVFEDLDGNNVGFRVISLAKDGNQYRIKPKKKTIAIFNGKAGKLNISKIVWDYVESKNYQLDKDSFLEWFATEILSKSDQYSKQEKEASYSVVYAVGPMESLILYGEDWVEEMKFEMEL